MREIIRPVYVIYHDQCPDGFGAAWAAFQALGYTTGNGSPVHYIPSKYGQRPPEMDPEGMVYILDFSYNLETMSKLWHRHGGRVALLDHHKSAMEELQGQLPGCHFDMNRSGAAIAWGYFKPFESMPELLAYVQDRDLWRWELPDSRAVNAAIEAAPMDFEVWSKLEIEELRTLGQPVVDRNNRRIEELLESACEVQIGDYTVPAVEADELASETAERLLELHPHAPFVAVFHHSADQDGNKVTRYSLRSGGRADVADIAREQGGGGHAAAAGFETPRA